MTQGRHYTQPPPTNLVTDEEVNMIIRGDTKLLITKAEELGGILFRSRLTTSQIRNIYGMAKKLEMRGYTESQNEMLLLKPKMAYAAARPGASDGTGILKNVLSKAIDCVTNQTEFEQFINFFEAILAYHRAAGGK